MVRVEFLRRPSLWLLVALLLADAGFIQLHRLHLQDGLGDRFSLEHERSYSEYFQHAKELMAAALAGVLFFRTGERLFAIWAGLFAYLFVDDAFEVHESAGQVLAGWWPGVSLFGLGIQHVGEILVSGAVGLVFLMGLAGAWRRSAPEARQFSLVLLALLAALAVFGVLIDTLHVAAAQAPWHYRLGIIEDGGEMVVLTMMLWVLFESVRAAQDSRARIVF